MREKKPLKYGKATVSRNPELNTQKHVVDLETAHIDRTDQTFFKGGLAGGWHVPKMLQFEN